MRVFMNSVYLSQYTVNRFYLNFINQQKVVEAYLIAKYNSTVSKGLKYYNKKKLKNIMAKTQEGESGKEV